MLKRGDKVYTQVVKNCSVSELMPIIRGKADTGAVLYSDGFKTYAYDGLVNYGYKSIFGSSTGRTSLPMGIIISTVLRTSGDCAKFRGIHKHAFYLHIKRV